MTIRELASAAMPDADIDRILDAKVLAGLPLHVLGSSV
jgi:hypothetical protein